MSATGRQNDVRGWTRFRKGIAWRLRVMSGRFRAFFYGVTGVMVGEMCTFQHRVEFIHRWRVRFGKECVVDAYAQFKCPTTVDPSVDYNIDIADNVFIGCGTIIDSNVGVRIGKNTFIAPYCFITDTHHIFADAKQPIREQGCEYRAVEIGEDVWVGAHVVILPGVKVGKGSVIGANSAVTHDIPSGVVAAGSPARVIKKRS